MLASAHNQVVQETSKPKQKTCFAWLDNNEQWTNVVDQSALVEPTADLINIYLAWWDSYLLI